LSRDICVLAIPEGSTRVDEIAADWRLHPLPFGHAEVVEVERELAPEVDTIDPESLPPHLPGVDVEVTVANPSPVEP
jgi:hypothetical protein